MTGQCFIDTNGNRYDLGATCGFTLADGALAALMAPPPVKEIPSNKSRLESGTRYIDAKSMLDERSVTLPGYVRASGYDDMTDKLRKLTSLLTEGGKVGLSTAHQPGTVYWLIYQSCSSFVQAGGRLALLSLRLIEPDPTDRS